MSVAISGPVPSMQHQQQPVFDLVPPGSPQSLHPPISVRNTSSHKFSGVLSRFHATLQRNVKTVTAILVDEQAVCHCLGCFNVVSL